MLAIEDARLNKQAIDEIVLVGGSTRIPKIQSILQDYFEGKNLNKQLHPDEAVAYGATVQAGILSGVNVQENTDIFLLDVIPLSLGIEYLEEEDISVALMDTIIKRNTAIPFAKTEQYCTSVDNQDEIGIFIVQGESRLAKDDHKVGHFDIKNIKKGPAGQEKIDVTFNIDANGILQVTARDVRTGNAESLIIKSDKMNLPKEEISRLVEIS